MNNNLSSQRGVALVAAIFLIVVIGLAVVVMSVLATRNTQQNTQSLLQMRAQSAAAAGLEYAAQNIVTTSTCTNVSGLALNGLSGFSVDVSCVSNEYNRPSQKITLFRLRAIAEYGNVGNADYVWSELTSTVEL
jgi:MSHA biogenesis protein MshP